MPDKKGLGAELFQLVESDIGYAHVSDGIETLDDDERVFRIARGSLKHLELAAKKIRKFLKKHGQEV